MIQTVLKGKHKDIPFREITNGEVTNTEVGDELITFKSDVGEVFTLFISHDSPAQQIKCFHDPQDGVNTKISDPELEGLRDLLFSLAKFESVKMEE